MKYLERLGAVIRDRRLAVGLSQTELGRSAGAHRTYISDIERGRRNLTVSVLSRIGACLNMPTYELMRMAEVRKSAGV